jgi:hypothetical protein
MRTVDDYDRPMVLTVNGHLLGYAAKRRRQLKPAA